MTQYARGRRKEYDVVRRLRASGWTAQRSAGSHGLWDVVAAKRDCRPLFVQVKYTSVHGGHGWQREENAVALLALGDETKTDTPLDAEVWVYTKGIAAPMIYAPWQGQWVGGRTSAGDR